MPNPTNILRLTALTALLATQLLACAHQEPNVQHTIRILDPPIQQTHPATGDFTLHNLALGPHHIQAEITYEPHCYTLVLDQIEHNKIYTNPRQNNAGVLLGAALSAIATDVLIDSAGGDPADRLNNEYRSSYTHNQTSATVLGGLLLASEILAYNLTTTPLTLRWTNIAERHRSSKHTCTTPRPPGGTIAFFHQNTLITQLDSPTETIDLDLHTIPELCNAHALHGQTIRITYTPHDTSDQLTLTESHTLQPC